jgi:hypothetical protein
LQDNIVVSGTSISGELSYTTGYTQFSSEPELQEGNYLVLHWSEPQTIVTSLKVGLVPSSIGMDLVECINDTDRNGVFRVTSPTQKFRMVQSDGINTLTTDFILSDLTLSPAGEG